jgi:hypothetical protein
MSESSESAAAGGTEAARPGRARKPLFPNPFYVVLLVASTVFVLTALLYCISPMVVQRGMRGGPKPGSASVALVRWLDRRGPITLGIEFLVMLASGSLAMATDNWFSPKPARRGATPGD